jgi:hypothetical protein
MSTHSLFLPLPFSLSFSLYPLPCLSLYCIPTPISLHVYLSLYSDAVTFKSNVKVSFTMSRLLNMWLGFAERPLFWMKMYGIFHKSITSPMVRS